MNTARKGAEYERAYRRVLEKAGYVVLRSAASKGPFDLVATSRTRMPCLHVQLKSGRMTCARAQALAATLYGEAGAFCEVRVVHHDGKNPFCAHRG